MSSARRPALAPGIRFVEQIFQGEPGYVVKRPDTGAYVRFRPHEAQVMKLFTGELTIHEIANRLAHEGLAISAATVDGFATRLAQLGLVERTLVEKSSAQLERLRQERRERRRKPLFRGEVLRMRFSFGDPDAMLARTLPWFRWCFTPAFVWGSVAVFLAYALLMVSWWPEMSGAFAQLLSPANLTVATALQFWVAIVVVGMVHEFGHAYACKGFNGSVNEMGFMILYFQPAFYCNVNDAWTFPRLRDRLWVTAAGAWVQMLFGALAALVWLAMPGDTVLSHLALIVTVFSGSMTLLSNANPLLPLDGYFALTDWLEIPNLRQRALAYFNWFISTRLLRRTMDEPTATDRERRVFLWYGSLATVYIAVMYTLVLKYAVGWTARTFGTSVAIIVTAVLATTQRHRLTIWWLALRDAWRDLMHVRLQHALRAVPAPLRKGPFIALLAVLLLLLPWPRNVDGSWQARPAGYTVVTAPGDGLVATVHVVGGDAVRAGAPLIRLLDRDAERRVALASLDRDSLQLRATARASRRDPLAALAEVEGTAAVARLRSAATQQRALVVRASVDGNVLTERPSLLEGKFVRAGTPVLHLGRRDSLEVRLRFQGAGAAAIATGQRVRLFLDADGAAPRSGILERVSLIASPDHPGETEAMVWMKADAAWPAGATGHARVRLGWSTIGGSILWAVRSRLRPDLFL